MMTPTNRQKDVYQAVITLQRETPDTAVTIESVALEAGVCWRTAQTHLKTLVNNGLLDRRPGSNPAGIGWAYIYYRRDHE